MSDEKNLTAADFTATERPLFWYWLDDDAPPGYEALRVDGIEWAGDHNRPGDYAAKYNGGWHSIAEAISRGWIRALGSLPAEGEQTP